MSKRRTQAAAEVEPTVETTTLSATSPAEPQEAASPQPEQRPSVKRASVLSDTAAGVRLYFDYEKHRAEIEFKEKPSAEVIAYMHEQRFTWDRELKVWQRPVQFAQREQDRLAARRAFHKATEMVRAEKGINEDGPGLPD